MERQSGESNSSVESYRSHNSPLDFSKTQCNMSTKASAFSIDALIGKRTLAQMQQCVFPSTIISDDDVDDRASPRGSCCSSPPAKQTRVADRVSINPLG